MVMLCEQSTLLQTMQSCLREQNQSIMCRYLVPFVELVLSDKIDTAITSLHDDNKDFVTTQYGKR